ncbi:unnamed protein product, partial [Ceratitis capitata]
MLNRYSTFDVGHTLIHLAIRFHREEMLPMLLAQISGSGPGIKRVPSYVAPDLAADIRRHIANSCVCLMHKSNYKIHHLHLLVLWSRSAGDCLLDSARQATWVVFDRDNCLHHICSTLKPMMLELECT